MAVAPWIVSDELWELVEPLLPKVERRFRYPGREAVAGPAGGAQRVTRGRAPRPVSAAFATGDHAPDAVRVFGTRAVRP